jgi:hypothetical protein
MRSASPRKRKRPASDEQDWGMLIFESLSAGGIAVFLAFVVVLVLAGVYGLVVWPLTHWDLAHVNGGSWWKGALGLIFALGTIIGFWCFSGAAFKSRPGQSVSATAPAKYNRTR